MYNSMTRMDGLSSKLTLSNDNEKNLEFLLDAFGSKLSADDMASAYCQAGHDIQKTCDILYSMLGNTSNNDLRISTSDLTNAPVSSVGISVGTVSRPKPRNSGVSVGSISDVIGSDYGKFRSSRNEARETTKPVKLMSSEFPASQIWDENPQPVNATTETMNKDVEQFLLKMLGDGFQLDMEVIKEVVGGCGYDVRKSMEKLMNKSIPNLDLGEVTSSLVHQTSTETCEDLNIQFEQNLQFSESAGRDRLNLEKELLSSLFTVPERSELGPGTILPKRPPRIRKYGLVTGPLEDRVAQFKTPIVKKEKNMDGSEEIEDNYDTLTQAAIEHWGTMKDYYRAAADAYAKGSYEKADKLIKGGHSYMAKAREANETSGKMLTQTKDDGEAISINLDDYDPKEAIRLLKTQLKSMSGIPSIQYLKVMLGTNEDKAKNARKRLITRLLEKDSITWTEEQDGQIMAIRIDVINPKSLSFNKK